MHDSTRRTFVGAISAAAAGALGLLAQTGGNRLKARPGSGAPATATPGLQKLGLRADRDALLYIP